MSLALASRASRAVAVALLLVAAAWLGKLIVTPAVAERLADRATSLAELEAAVAWDPTNPALRLGAGRAAMALGSAADLDRARGHLEAALRQRPLHAETWLELAALADRQGRPDRARLALDTALRLDPHSVALRWEAALVFLRWGEPERALEHFRYVVAVDPGRRAAAFRLAASLLPPGQPVASLLPAEPDALTGMLQFAVQERQVELAEAVWARRVRLAPALPAPLQRQYVQLLLDEGEGQAARAAWLAIVPDGAPAAAGNLVWNGGFEHDTLLGWGLDWRIRRAWGVEVALDRLVVAKGRQSLRLSFNSFPTLDFAGVVQTVAVEPGREYRLSALVRARDFTTRSGLKLQATTADGETLLAETDTVAGTTADWVALGATLQIPEGTRLVQVRLRREKAPAPEGNLGGKVWVDEVSLVPSRGAS